MVIAGRYFLLVSCRFRVHLCDPAAGPQCNIRTAWFPLVSMTGPGVTVEREALRITFVVPPKGTAALVDWVK